MLGFFSVLFFVFFAGEWKMPHCEHWLLECFWNYFFQYPCRPLSQTGKCHTLGTPGQSTFCMVCFTGDICTVYYEKLELNITKKNESNHFIFILGITYLDHAGATLFPDSLLKAFTEDLRNNVYGKYKAVHHYFSQDSLQIGQNWSCFVVGRDLLCS